MEGHHYALIVVGGLEPGRSYPYEIALDGELRWPDPGSPDPPSAVRTLPERGDLRLSFGSCRVAAPHQPPYTLTKDEDRRGREVDALYALAARMRRTPPEEWPHVLLLLGDQVYADEVSPGVRDFIHSRRDPAEPPGEQVADFEEYTRLYWESWRDPSMRWLLSTVSTAMIFDDHDVHDDWNTSLAWVEEKRAQSWWDRRIVGAFMSYWIYQHIGNLSPAELERTELFRCVRELPDATAKLRDFALRADRENQGSRWSYARDLGDSRLVVMDSRAGRVLDGGGPRRMLDSGEWGWIEETASGEFDHLLLATTLPYLLAPAMHHVEAWNEAVCDGAWGGAAARAGERLRQALDLEHWAAFRSSFEELTDLIRRVGAGEHGRPPATILALSGDVHHAYLSEVAFRRRDGVRSAVYQAVCSPIRNPLDSHERHLIRLAASRPALALARGLSHAAGLEDPPIRWRFAQDPAFDNQVATLELSGRRASLMIERTRTGDPVEPRLERVLERRLA